MKKKIALFIVITMLLQLFSLTVSAENDTMSNYNTSVSNPITSTVYYLSHIVSEEELETNSLNDASGIVSVQTAESDWIINDSTTYYKKSGYDIVNAGMVKLSEKAALEKVSDFAKINNIIISKDSEVEHGTITKSRLSADGTCFVDKQVLAHTFTIKPSLQSKNSSTMYFEVTDSGVVEFVSVTQ